jgi:hypothetical protein
MVLFRVDIWSAGAIFAELIMRRQLFPGRDAAMQIKARKYLQILIDFGISR